MARVGWGHSTDGTFVDLHTVWGDSVAVVGDLVTELEPVLAEPIVVRTPRKEVVRLEGLYEGGRGPRAAAGIWALIIGGGLLYLLGRSIDEDLRKWEPQKWAFWRQWPVVPNRVQGPPPLRKTFAFGGSAFYPLGNSYKADPRLFVRKAAARDPPVPVSFLARR